ncbi:Ldh family oxidoreductase [Plastoroseomonas hellenica]|uniref:Ldh family oxidoreductase n=1 Tax=Plastoroseomonas hellenica TaxID=2687306 RepID=UPI001BA7DC8B|nr:Ldh family oxidoreductase [Plastoroseomonas hellenica]MBR0644641.1 Ldh family oxidoreductase [Plastoroseomonas hellenica]
MTEATIGAAELEALATRALTTGGMMATDAADAARIMVLADLFGIRTHGISRVAQYLERVKLGGIDARAAVTVEALAPALLRVDGGNGIGPLIGMRTLQAAMAAARSTGMAGAFVRGSNHFGPIMPYLFLAAQEGFAAIIASNATTTIAPWGGKGARLGNNPLGFGIPGGAGADPILLDVALSVAARAKIRNAAAKGEAIPEGWATDADGQPTTDPKAALQGFLLAIAGHKGYGLAVMVDMFAGLLSGAAYLTHVKAWDKDPGAAQDLGHVFLLIDAKRLLPGDALSTRVGDAGAILHATPPADPARPVRLPGEIEMALYHAQSRSGVRVASADLDAVRRLADPR